MAKITAANTPVKKTKMTKEKLLEVDNLHTYYTTRSGQIKAVNGLSFTVNKGETLGIVGETGAGKTTVASSIIGLIPNPPGKQHNGQIKFKGKRIDNLEEEDRRKYRGSEISMIFQDSMTALNPVMKVIDQIKEVVIVHSIEDKRTVDQFAIDFEKRLMTELKGIAKKVSFKGDLKKLIKLDTAPEGTHPVLVKAVKSYKKQLPKKDKEGKKFLVKGAFRNYFSARSEGTSIEILETVGISRDRVYQYPHQFSGGMKQRVVIAIALVNKPALLLADEPTTALDVTIQAQIIELINNLKDTLGTSTVFITHDLGVVAQTCDTVAVMYGGKIIERGTVEELFKSKCHPYTLGLFKSIPTITGKVGSLSSVPGEPANPYDHVKGCVFASRCEKAMDICFDRHPEDKVLKKSAKGLEHSVACFLFDKTIKKTTTSKIALKTAKN